MSAERREPHHEPSIAHSDCDTSKHGASRGKCTYVLKMTFFFIFFSFVNSRARRSFEQHKQTRCGVGRRICRSLPACLLAVRGERRGKADDVEELPKAESFVRNDVAIRTSAAALKVCFLRGPASVTRRHSRPHLAPTPIRSRQF